MGVGKGRLVWFIDDEPYYTRAYREHLLRADFALAYIETMTEAIKRLRDWNRDQPAAIILDIQMPRPEEMTDGDMLDYHDSPGLWFVLRYAAQTFQVRSVPIFVLTQPDPAPKEPLFQQIRDRKIKLEVHRKIETSARDLPTLLAEFLES